MAGIEVRETRLERPWYAPGPPDPEPPLLPGFGRRGLPVYPYTVTESLSAEPIPRAFRAVEIENDYLRLTFLPELNGRLYSLYDKLAARETLFANPELKPALVGVRGPWCATGIEVNCPSSHTVTTVDEVPCEWGVDEIGQGWFRAHDIEAVSGAAWSCTTILEPNSARVQMITRFANPTEEPARYYLWINAAFPVAPDSRFIFPPSTRQIFMEGGQHPGELGYLDYPVHDGVDVSVLHNLTKHSSNFAVTPDEGFFGLYHPSSDHGVVHYADPHLVPGRKVWTWGFAPDGTLWHDALSETGGPYCELQSGPLRSQLEYRTIAPGQVIEQRDVWLPIRGLGGLSWAGEGAALYYEQTRGDRLYARLLTARPGPVLLRRGEWSMTVDAGPEPITVELPHDPETPLRIESEVGPLCPAVRFTPPPPRTTWTHEQARPATSYQRARARWWAGNHREARKLFREAAEEDSRAAAAMARYARWRGNDGSAARWVRRGLAIDGSCPEMLREAALLARTTREGERAQVWFWEELLAHPSARPAALIALIDLALAEGQPHLALERAEALGIEGGDFRLLGRAMHAARRAGRPLAMTLDLLADAAPLDPLLSAELRLIGEQAPELTVTGQLAAAETLAWLGDHSTAVQVLEWSPAPGPGQLPALRIAAQAAFYGEPTPHDLVWGEGFCGGRFAIDVLQACLAIDEDDEPARYHLACALAAGDAWDEAEVHWAACTGGPWAAEASRNLGLSAWQIRGDKEAAAAFYRQAVELDCGPRTFVEQDRLLAELGRHESREAPLRDGLARFGFDSRVPLRLASALVDLGRCDEALELLAGTDFRVFEGGGGPQQVWRNAHLKLADEHLAAGRYREAADEFGLGCEYPENLHSGAPAEYRDAEVRYRQAQASVAAGDADAAAEAYRLGAELGTRLKHHGRPSRELFPEAGPLSVSRGWVRNRLYRAACLRELGEAEAAGEVLDEVEALMNGRHVPDEIGESVEAARQRRWPIA